MDFKNTLFHKMTSKQQNILSLKFQAIENDELRVITALNSMKIFDIVPQSKCESKDPKISVYLRNEANRIFISSQNVEEFIKVWELYSKSIAKAPNFSQELSLAYANRSALLIKLCKYRECIEDINRALELNYPSHLKGKLFCRKIECLQSFNNIDKLTDTIKEAKSWLRNISICSNEKKKFEEKFKKAENFKCFKSFPKINKIKRVPTVAFNMKIPCASEALTIKFNEKFGRHIITTHKVNPGEILVMEKPYANILMQEEVYTHCSHCLQIYWAMIPCEFCIHAMYCSHNCKNEAWKQYHDIECPVTGYLLKIGFDKFQLFSMRLTILALREAGSIEKLRHIIKNANNDKDPCRKGFAEDGIYHSDKYNSLCTLVTNTEKRSVSDLFHRSLDAANILYYLCTLSTLFGKKFDQDLHKIILNQDATYIGGLILRHLQIIPSNIHSYEEERKIDTVDIGASALPFCSLINHSCDPNISRISTKEYMIVFALVPIEKGAQIYDCYGSHYAIMNKFEREEKLKQFYFKCECIACKENWPTYQNLLSFDMLLNNQFIKRKIETTLTQFHKYVEYALEDNIENKPYILKNLRKMINIMMKYVPLPCCEVNNVVETLKRVFILTYGNKFEIPKLCK